MKILIPNLSIVQWDTYWIQGTVSKIIERDNSRWFQKLHVLDDSAFTHKKNLQVLTTEAFKVRNIESP